MQSEIFNQESRMTKCPGDNFRGCIIIANGRIYATLWGKILNVLPDYHPLSPNYYRPAQRKRQPQRAVRGCRLGLGVAFRLG